MLPPVICIVGKKKSGKTWLMEELIKEFKKRDLRVGALKHHKHDDFDIDIEGKDTWKYAKAGADTVAISSPVKLAIIKKTGTDTGLDELCKMYFSGLDYVLAEGYALSDKPRIILTETDEDVEIFGRGCDVVSTVEKDALGKDAGLISDIADLIIEYFQKKR